MKLQRLIFTEGLDIYTHKRGLYCSVYYSKALNRVVYLRTYGHILNVMPLKIASMETPIELSLDQNVEFVF